MFVFTALGNWYDTDKGKMSCYLRRALRPVHSVAASIPYCWLLINNYMFKSRWTLAIGLSNLAQLICNNLSHWPHSPNASASQTQISDVCSLNAVLCECVYPLHISLMTPHDPHLRQVMAPCYAASRLAAILTRTVLSTDTSQAMHAWVTLFVQGSSSAVFWLNRISWRSG